MDYSYIKKVYYDSIYNLKNIEENIQMVLLSMIGFFVPFVLGHPQILVGIIVNAMLILGATYMRGHKLLPLILMPSIGVMTAGILFGNYTVFLLYLIPLIWLGNAVYVYAYKYFNMTTHGIKNNLIGLGVASVAKTVLLFGVTFLLVSFAILPSMFLSAMGMLQIVTALIGGIVAIGIIKTREQIVG